MQRLCTDGLWAETYLSPHVILPDAQETRISCIGNDPIRVKNESDFQVFGADPDATDGVKIAAFKCDFTLYPLLRQTRKRRTCMARFAANMCSCPASALRFWSSSQRLRSSSYDAVRNRLERLCERESARKQFHRVDARICACGLIAEGSIESGKSDEGRGAAIMKGATSARFLPRLRLARRRTVPEGM